MSFAMSKTMKRTKLTVSAIVAVSAIGLPREAAATIAFDSGRVYDVTGSVLDYMFRVVSSFDGYAGLVAGEESGMRESASIQFSEPELVDLELFARFASQWLRTDCGAPGWCTGADFEQNGRVDFRDLREFVSYWLVEEPTELQDLLFRERQIGWQKRQKERNMTGSWIDSPEDINEDLLE
jgi:hypothetical protein